MYQLVSGVPGVNMWDSTHHQCELIDHEENHLDRQIKMNYLRSLLLLVILGTAYTER